MTKPNRLDSDEKKGASEEEFNGPTPEGVSSMQGQLGHRDQDELLKDADSDFPEPGSSPEYSGETS